jgi:CRISPR-associated protein Csd2
MELDVPNIDVVPSEDKLPVDRYDIIYYVRARYCNPNGDPDMDNQPRQDPNSGHGLMSPQSLKRRIRDHIEQIVHAVRNNKMTFKEELGDKLATTLKPDLEDRSLGYHIYVKTSCNLRTREQFANALHVTAGGNLNEIPRHELLCKYFYDVRTFGSLITMGVGAGKGKKSEKGKKANAEQASEQPEGDNEGSSRDQAGMQLIGPVQVSFGWSLEPINILRIGCTGPSREDPGIEGLEKMFNPEQILEEENKLKETNTGKIRTMGHGYVVDDAVYRFQISVSPFQAVNTGFNGTDLALLLVALKRWPDWYKTSSKTGMEHVRAFIFKHGSRYGNMPIWEIQEKLDETLKEMGIAIDQAEPKALAEKLKDKLGGSIEVFTI